MTVRKESDHQTGWRNLPKTFGLMSTNPDTMAGTRRQRPYAAIVLGGLCAGVFDITQAFIGFGLLGATPHRILQHIAGGIFGRRSYDMGLVSAALGLALHFTIAFTAATVYYAISRKMSVLLEHPVACGLLYGEAVFVFMYFVVLPLSALGPAQFTIATYITGPIGHPVLVGLPIARSVRHFSDSARMSEISGATAVRLPRIFGIWQR